MAADTPDIRLIATDLDGTLIGSANEFPLYNDFRERVGALKQHNGVLWAACTGRSFGSFWDFFSPMRTMGLLPDYVVVRHAFIFGLTRFGYLPHVFWNLHIRYLLWVNRLYVREAVSKWQQLMTGGALGVSTVYRRKNRLCLRFDTDEAAGVAADLLRERARHYKHLRVFRYNREVDVREVPFTKGLAVQELARHLGIAREHILAIGNGSNDISMLGGDVARYTGCPSNSEAEVIEVVHASGGHIATGRSLTGVMEILGAVFGGEVRSELPEGWTDPETQRNPLSKRGSHPLPEPPQSHRTKKRRQRWLLVGAVYVVIAAFASFGLVPYGDIVVKPLVWLAGVIERFVRWAYQ